MNDIETATIDQLYDEIKSRCNGCVLIMRKPLKNPTEDGTTTAFAIRWGDNDFALSLGLIEQAKFSFERQYMETYEDIDPAEAGLEE